MAFVPEVRYSLFPPSEAAIEERLNGGYARADGKAYRVSAKLETGIFGDITVSGTVSPATNEVVMGFAGAVQHSKGDLYTVKKDGETQLFRNYGEPDISLAPTDLDERYEVKSRSGKTYKGTVGDGPFTLVLDGKVRFKSLAFDTVEGVAITLTYEYDDVAMPVFASAAPRGPCDISDVPLFEQQPETRLSVSLDSMADAVRPSEIELHYLDSSSIVVREAPFESTASDGGFFFQWTDANANGLVDEGDSYAVEFPATVDHVKVFDEWVGAYVADVERLNIPGPSFLVAVVALWALAGLVRRLES